MNIYSLIMNWEQARLASLGLQKAVSVLRSIASSAKPEKSKTQVREYNKKDDKITPLRRSDRLKQTTATADVTRKQISRRRSERLRGKEGIYLRFICFCFSLFPCALFGSGGSVGKE
jgi:acetyl-CoA carboxylase carboxyltransferase component